MFETSIVRPEHTGQVKEMWKYCFGDDDNFIDWFFSNVYDCKNTVAVYDGECIAANLQMFPEEISLCGKTLSAMYVGGVAVRPEYRGKGLVTKLFYDAFNLMYERGTALALLIPFKFSFYRKYGFEATHFLSDYEGNIEELVAFKRSGGEFTTSLQGATDIYSSFVKDKNAYLIRGNKDFASITDELKVSGGKFYALSEGGYLYYKIENNCFNVFEIAYKGYNELTKLLGFIYSHASQVQNFKIRTAADGFLRQVLCDKGVSEITYPHVMTRIINAKEILETLSTKMLPGNVALEIKDDIITQNNKAYSVSPFNAEETEFGMSININTLSLLATGTISPKTGEDMGLINASNQLDRLFIKKNNYINMLGWV